MGITYDMHTHCDFSTDSKTPVEQQIESAINRGLSGICLTDHMDYDFPPEERKKPSENPPFVFDEKKYKQKLEECRRRYPEIWIGTGVECGLQPTQSTVQQNRTLTEQPDWDFIIGSVHLVEGKDPYYPEFWRGKKPAHCVRRYLEQMLESITQFSDFDSLGHLDYVVRYAPSDFVYDPSDYREITEEILKMLIRKDIALEINSSGLSSCAGCENPHPDLLKQYVSLGGELITIGSDAHIPERIAGGFSVLETHIKEAGLHRFVTFHRRKPVFHTL